MAHVAALLVLCLPLFFLGSGSRPLWDIDEGMHASTSKVMVQTGDWVTPTFNGENFYDKPILFNWLEALSFSLLGFTEFAARLPAALLAVGVVIVSYWLGSRMFGPAAGFLGALILATSPLAIVLSRIVVHDICLVFCVALSLAAFYASHQDEGRRDWYLVLFYLACGAAVLAKGPVGVLLPGLIIGAYLLLTRDLGFVRRMRLGWGLALFLVVAAPWYVLISLRNPDYAYYFFVHQNLMRFFSPTIQHAAPVFQHVPILSIGLVPWFVYLPLALVRGWRAWRRDGDRASAYLLLWTAITFVFFSAASSKGQLYMAPLLPAVCLLLGKVWAEFLETGDDGLRKWFAYSFAPFVIGVPIGAAVLFTHPPLRLQQLFGFDIAQINLIAVLLIAAVAVAGAFLLTRRLAAFFWAHVVLVVSMTVLIVTLILPAISRYRSTKTLALAYDTMVPPEQPLLFYGRFRESALFYTNRGAKRLWTPDEVRQLMDGRERAFVIMKSRDLEKLEHASIHGYVVEEEADKVIWSNRKASNP